MNIVDIIGYIGMAIILYSFTVREMYKLRLINSIGCLFWIAYGIGIMAGPTILVNSCVLVIHSYWFYTNRKRRGLGGESIKENFNDSNVSNNSVDGDIDFMYKWIRKHSGK